MAAGIGHRGRVSCQEYARRLGASGLRLPPFRPLPSSAIHLKKQHWADDGKTVSSNGRGQQARQDLGPCAGHGRRGGAAIAQREARLRVGELLLDRVCTWLESWASPSPASATCAACPHSPCRRAAVSCSPATRGSASCSTTPDSGLWTADGTEAARAAAGRCTTGMHALGRHWNSGLPRAPGARRRLLTMRLSPFSWASRRQRIWRSASGASQCFTPTVTGMAVRVAIRGFSADAGTRSQHVTIRRSSAWTGASSPTHERAEGREAGRVLRRRLLARGGLRGAYRLAAFMHLRGLGWLVRSGALVGGDWVVYRCGAGRRAFTRLSRSGAQIAPASLTPGSIRRPVILCLWSTRCRCPRAGCWRSRTGRQCRAAIHRTTWMRACGWRGRCGKNC